jgi:hypothetical protein
MNVTVYAFDLANLTFNIGILTAVVKEGHDYVSNACDRLFSSASIAGQTFYDTQMAVCNTRLDQCRGYRTQLLLLRKQPDLANTTRYQFFEEFDKNLNAITAVLNTTLMRLDTFNRDKKTQSHTNETLSKAFDDLDDVQQFFNGNVKALVAKSDSVDRRLYAEGKAKFSGALKTLSEQLTGLSYCSPYDTSQDLLYFRTQSTTVTPIPLLK